ncbi:MAG: hypothetical protein BWX47_01893 [candidate division Hyd24-12 bacterium ADurb.Bin004]|nr:MAG: hypothetical protein BWX47_01893 [candidate division Hyd24-12 bacterium ADurb.Bin004]
MTIEPPSLSRITMLAMARAPIIGWNMPPIMPSLMFWLAQSMALSSKNLCSDASSP